jgi:delta-aminolevulinic acid dehydratase/porphobilinogen synthase
MRVKTPEEVKTDDLLREVHEEDYLKPRRVIFPLFDLDERTTLQLPSLPETMNAIEQKP